MPEQPQNPNEIAESKEKIKAEKIALAKKLFENGEDFPFPGINKDAYDQMKADEEIYPGISTPIEELVERCRDEGIKVVLGDHPESGNVYILPMNSTNIEMDSFFPRHLVIEKVANEELRRLIALDGGREE